MIIDNLEEKKVLYEGVHVTYATLMMDMTMSIGN